ncbi:MAG: hypothetical protein F2621_02325 [Actinobacteria bacterium]|nr:hypothetical protein [Actinomycetota bacterium]MTA32499.1 hypothetical protein [Actinomycetota bacterium]
MSDLARGQGTSWVVDYYVVSFVRSAASLAVGLTIAFTPAHTAQFGLVTFGVMALVTSVTLGVLAVGLESSTRARGLHIWQSLVSLVVGALAVGLSTTGTLFLLWAIVLWSLLVGVSELFAGWRLPSGSSLRGDWIVQGTMTVLLALVVLSQSADSVAVVGFVGAWAVIMGVYLAIAGFSARWAQKDTAGEG